MAAETFISPQSYKDASPELRSKVCNGCGPSNWRVDVVPDSLFGVDIAEVCNIHDWMYHEGHDKELADAVFLANMTRACKAHHDVLYPGRVLAAVTYYFAVSRFGDECFGDPEEA